MTPRWTMRRAGRVSGPSEAIISPARPLIRATPKSTIYLPLVVLVAILPGLYALGRWDLNPPGPWWGLRGLAVLDGMVLDQVPASAMAGPDSEARGFHAVACQPPLYAWLEALGLALSPNRSPLATILPSYMAGALVVLLVYLHGRLWGGPGLGLVAAVLMGFNRDLLVQMQQATPTTLGLAGALLALLAYGQHLRPVDGPRSRTWWWCGGIAWAALGGLALGLALLAVGGFALVVVPVVLLHQAYLGAESAPCERPSRWWRAGRSSPSLVAGALTLGIALALAGPWHVGMYGLYGRSFLDALMAPPDPGGLARPGLLRHLLDLAPAVFPLGLYAAVRVVRQALRADEDDRSTVGGVFWLVWLAVAALVPSAWPSGPKGEFALFLLVPLNLLAARAVGDLADRRIPVRTLTWLAPVTALAVAWWGSPDLRGSIAAVARGERPDPATVLGLHLALDLILGAALATRMVDRWARRRDGRQRLVLGGFFLAVLATTSLAGIREVRFRHRETRELLSLREVVLRLHQDRPFTHVVVVGPGSAEGLGEDASLCPGSRLRFILRSALPGLPQIDLPRADDLLKLPDGQRLVILVGEQRLPYALQSQLNLGAIHPGRSGVLDAFATSNDTEQIARK